MSLLTRPVAPEYIDEFYRLVRPFGWWSQIKQRVLASGKPVRAPLRGSLVAVNVLLGIVATYALYMAPVYFMGKWYIETAVALGLFAGCCAALYFTWYKTLPED